MNSEEIVEQAKVDGYLLRRTRRPDDPGANGCWLGGMPRLPMEIDWPFTEPDDTVGIPRIPMHFVCQINLAELPSRPTMPRFPTKGTLFFFFDPLFSASRDFKRGTYKVIYEARDTSECAPREMPLGLPKAFSDENILEAYSDNPTTGYKKWNVSFLEATTYNSRLDFSPGFQEAVLLARIKSDKELEKLAKVRSYEHLPRHFIACGPSSFARRESGIIKYYHDLVPLLSISDDDELGISLGIADFNVVFWIERQDLEIGDFSKVFAFSGV